MYLYDNLVFQIEEYDKIEDYMEKIKYIEILVDYYKKSKYESNNKTQCLNYWENMKEFNYKILFRYL